MPVNSVWQQGSSRSFVAYQAFCVSAMWWRYLTLTAFVTMQGPRAVTVAHLITLLLGVEDSMLASDCWLCAPLSRALSRLLGLYASGFIYG